MVLYRYSNHTMRIRLHEILFRLGCPYANCGRPSWIMNHHVRCYSTYFEKMPSSIVGCLFFVIPFYVFHCLIVASTSPAERTVYGCNFLVETSSKNWLIVRCYFVVLCLSFLPFISVYTSLFPCFFGLVFFFSWQRINGWSFALAAVDLLKVQPTIIFQKLRILLYGRHVPLILQSLLCCYSCDLYLFLSIIERTDPSFLSAALYLLKIPPWQFFKNCHFLLYGLHVSFLCHSLHFLSSYLCFLLIVIKYRTDPIFVLSALCFVPKKGF